MLPEKKIVMAKRIAVRVYASSNIPSQSEVQPQVMERGLETARPDATNRDYPRNVEHEDEQIEYEDGTPNLSRPDDFEGRDLTYLTPSYNRPSVPPEVRG